ncbi:hypothetical protein ABTZ03_22165 [Kitasatospora sp. NPDC096077]|uniref:hypothetical protein n=1 Tax=Kitasatospora sp. NPDC096077 TaxID=3155544 RepID=UPI00331CA1F8
MTDEFPRSGGADRDGPAETPTERLLREAMAARTSVITPHSLRPAAPPKGRVRRLRPVYLTAVPIFALAASAAIGLLAFHGDPVAKRDVPPPPAASLTVSPSPTATASPTATPSATGSAAAGTDTPAAGSPSTTSRSTGGAPTGPSTPVEFRGVKLKVPAGWRVQPYGKADLHLCVLSPGAPQTASAQDCRPYGVDLAVFDPGSPGWPAVEDLDAQSGWSHQPDCPVWGNPHPPAAGESVKAVGPTKSTPTVAGRPGAKSQWQVTCGQDAFTAQVWAVPQDQVFVSAVGLKDDYQAGLASIVDSLDVGDRESALSATPAANDSAAPTANDIAVSIDGLTTGQSLRVGSAVATFTVTFQNTSQHAYAQVEPLVFTDRYAGTPTLPGTQLPNDGKLERQTDSGWTTKPMSPDAGMAYAQASDQDLFALAPGQRRTLTYRLTMGPKSGPGDMPLRAQAVLPYHGGDLTALGHQDISLKLVW